MGERNIEVKITGSFPIFVHADADAFGAMFANMASDEQVSVLSAISKHMEPHRTQWDYISIELEEPENRDLRNTLRDVLFPDHAATMKEVVEVLEFYANPEIYNPHPHGLAFDKLEKTCVARALLSKLSGGV